MGAGKIDRPDCGRQAALARTNRHARYRHFAFERKGQQSALMMRAHRRIPAQMRAEERAGSTPDQQLTQSLKTISGEIDSITRQLAEGSLDDLAIKHRFLDYKFGTGDDAAPQLGYRLPEQNTKDPG